MAAGKLNIAIEQGATWRRRLTWHEPAPDNSDPGTLGPPKDLTNCTAHMQIRQKAGTPVLVNLTDANGGIVLGGDAGTIDIVITAAQTASVTLKAAAYDLYVTFPPANDGEAPDVRRVLEGTVTNDLTVTTADS